MSVINKKPLISKVVSNLTAAEKNKLLLGLNGGLSKSVKVFNSLTTTDKDISLLDLKFDDGVKTGYLIYNDLVSVFIAFYSDTQRLSLFNLDITQHTYTSSREYLTIDELRNVVELGLIEQGEHLKVQADDVDSGSATAGYVLTANGEGGATWEEGGSEIEDATDVLCELTDGDNIPVIAGDLVENNHLMYANFRHEYGTTTIGTSDTTGEDLELHAFNYQSVRNTGGTITDVANYNYSDGNIVCHTALEYSEFMTLIGASILNMGVNQDVEIYDSLNISNPAEIIKFLYKIYQYKIVRLVFADINDMYIEIDNKDVEFTRVNNYPIYLPTTFKGKVHMNDSIDLGNIDMIATLSFEEVSSNYQIALRIKAVPHVEENQFLAPEYDTTASYVAGDLCLHLGVLYVCTANTSGTFDDSDWQPTTIAGSVLGLLNTGV